MFVSWRRDVGEPAPIRDKLMELHSDLVPVLLPILHAPGIIFSIINTLHNSILY